MEAHDLIIFDGVCNLCSSAVRFIIYRDLRDQFRFTPMQSELGRSTIANYVLATTELDTFLLVSENKLYVRSDAALRVASRLSFPWRLFAAFRLIPRPIRDWIYEVVAKNRYHWFGRSGECMVPSPEIKKKFLT